MAGYEVEIAEIRTAADGARSAGEQASSVEVNSAVAAVPTGLPGSRSGPAITKWADHFTTRRCRNWGTWATGHADRLTTTADEYAANEQAATEAFKPAH
ncbi:hypothetical protein [Actinophytocola sediminis]